jgi:hypothetical protein
VDQRIVRIASELRDHFLDSFLKRDDVSIFLCGGSSTTEAQFRRDLGAAIAGTKSKYRYSVFYPEDMFVELILGHQRQDLLTLENLLAQSVSAVLILVQSPGTFAELGAFSNHPQLKNKLIVVMDPRYQNTQSFVNTGPIRHLRKGTSSHVIYEKMEIKSLDNLTKAVVVAAREIGQANPPTINLTNPIACYEFYLALIYVLEPVPKSSVLDLTRVLQPDAESLVLTAAETTINALLNQRDALLVSGKLSVSQKGTETLFAGSRTEKRRAELRTRLSGARIEALNVILRKKWRGIWGGGSVNLVESGGGNA